MTPACPEEVDVCENKKYIYIYIYMRGCAQDPCSMVILGTLFRGIPNISGHGDENQ